MRVSDFELITPMISGLWLRFVELVPISECCLTDAIRQLELRKEDELNQRKYKPPWIDLDDDADESDVEDVVGNGVEALVWRSMLGPGCGVYFKKRMNQDGGDTFMPLNEVLFRLEHLLVFD